MNHARKDVVLMYVMGALLAFAAYNFLFRPQRADLSSARDSLQRVEQDISDARLTLQAPVDSSTARSLVSAEAVPDSPALSTLLRQLQTTAEETGVAVSSISPTPLAVNPNGPGGSVQISITASGAHDAALDYLARLRDLERVVVIDQIGLDTQPGQPSQLQLSIRVFTREAPVTATETLTTAAP